MGDIPGSCLSRNMQTIPPPRSLLSLYFGFLYFFFFGSPASCRKVRQASREDGLLTCSFPVLLWLSQPGKSYVALFEPRPFRCLPFCRAGNAKMSQVFLSSANFARVAFSVTI